MILFYPFCHAYEPDTCPTHNRPFADKRDKVDMDGVPKTHEFPVHTWQYHTIGVAVRFIFSVLTLFREVFELPIPKEKGYNKHQPKEVFDQLKFATAPTKIEVCEIA